MREFDFTTTRIKDNLNRNTTDYVNMFTSLFLVAAFTTLVYFVKDKPNSNVYVPIVFVCMAFFLLHFLYKMVLIIKRRIKTNRIIDNDELATGKIKMVSLECHRGRYDVHALLSFMRIKVDNTWCYAVLPEALPIKRIKFYKGIRELIKNSETEASYFKSSRVLDLSKGEFFKEVVKLSELK